MNFIIYIAVLFLTKSGEQSLLSSENDLPTVLCSLNYLMRKITQFWKRHVSSWELFWRHFDLFLAKNIRVSFYYLYISRNISMSLVGLISKAHSRCLKYGYLKVLTYPRNIVWAHFMFFLYVPTLFSPITAISGLVFLD